MPENRKSITVYTDLAADLWADADDAAREDVPLEDPREGQVLAWILGEYLDRELVAVGSQNPPQSHHSDPNCPNAETLRLYEITHNAPIVPECSLCKHGGQLGNILRRNGGKV